MQTIIDTRADQEQTLRPAWELTTHGQVGRTTTPLLQKYLQINQSLATRRIDT